MPLLIPRAACLLISGLFALLVTGRCMGDTPPLFTPPGPGNWIHEEVRRFPAAEAKQGVAVDGEFFYAIDNHTIGKYRKDTGERTAVWEGGKDGALIHLNAGVVHDGRLYCAHSNFPASPITSSVEIWDTSTMKHVGTQSFGIYEGSLTWAVPQGSQWYACFAQYAKQAETAGRESGFTQIVKFDDQWRRLAGWVFPHEVTALFGKHSASGGGFDTSGTLFVTGHDARELYVVEVPEAGSVLKWTATIPISASGQAFCWDPSEPGMFYSISRKTREVIVSKVHQRP